MRDGERRGGRDDRHGGSGGGRNFFTPAPVNVGDELDVTITEVSQRGDGIARVQGFVVFVAGAAKGESCRVRVNDVRRRFAIGEKI